MSLDDKVGRHRARFRKVYPYGNTRRPDVRSFVDAITNTTKSFDFQKIQHDYPYYSVPTYLSTSWAMSGGISYATFLEATETFTNQTSYTVTFSTPFGGTPYLAFAPSQSQFSGSDGQETPNVAWWVTGLTSGGFTANFSAPFTGKITYRGVYTTGSYPIYVNRNTDLSGSYAWVSAGSSSLTNQSSLSMSFAALPSLPEFLNYNPVGSTSDELNIGQTIWAVSNSYAVNELSAPFTGIIHFLAMDTTGSDTSPFTANPDTNYPPTGSFAPSDISDLYAWYRGDTVTYDGSNKVSVWPDKSGNGNHLSQSNSAKQPVYSGSISSRNNQPGIHATGGAYLQAENFALRTYKTIFIVVGSTGSMSYVSSLYNGGVEYFYAYHPGLATFYNKDNSAGRHYITNTGGNFFQANVNHTFEYDGVTPTLYRSSSNVAGTVTGAATADNYATGSFSLFSGWAGGYSSTMQILEVLVYNKGLNTSERTQVWDYLTSRYGT